MMKFTEQGFQEPAPYKTIDRFAALMQEQPDLNAKQAASKLGIHPRAVYPHAKKLGIKFRYSTLGYGELARMLGRRAKGWRLEDLSTLTGLTKSGISTICIKYGVRRQELIHKKTKEKAITAIYDAILKSETYTEFCKNYPAEYLRACRWKMLDEVKSKFED